MPVIVMLIDTERMLPYDAIQYGVHGFFAKLQDITIPPIVMGAMGTIPIPP